MRELTPEEVLEAESEAAAGLDLLDTPQAGPVAIRGSLLRVGGYVAGMLLSVVSVRLLIQHLGVADFGRYVTVLSLVTIVQGVTDAGMTSIGVREYSLRKGADRDRLMRNLLGVRFALTLVGLAFATAFAALAGYRGDMVAGTLLVGLGLLFTVLQTTLAVPLAAPLRLGLVTATDLARQALSVAGIVALVAIGGSLLSFFAVPVPVGVTVLVITAVLVRGSTPMLPSFEPVEWRELMRSVLPFAAAAALGTIYFRVTIIVMSLIASEEQTGYYATAYRVLEVLVAVPGLLAGSVLPVLARAARDDADRLRYVLQRLFDAMVVCGVGAGLLLALGAPVAIAILAGSHADPAIEVLRIQAIALTANFVATAWQFGLLSLHQHRALLFNSAFALALSVVLTLSLVPSLDAKGAAIAAAIGESSLAIVAALQIRRVRPDLWPSFSVALRVLLALLLAGAVGFIPGLGAIPATLVGGAVYFGALIVLRALPVEVLDALTGRTRT